MTGLTELAERAGQTLEHHIGLRMEASLRGRLTRALRDAAADSGITPEAFVASIDKDPTSLQRLCDRVTVQESGFFRHPEQFDLLVHHVLPSLDRPVKIWSAACGNGQEPYSLAIVLEELGIPGTVLSTDLSAAAVRRVLEASYTDRELGGLSPARRNAFCRWNGSTWTMTHVLRERVVASVRNLVEPLSADVAASDVVFCRNVLIYFTADHATSFLDRLADRLRPGAYLFLGGAESLWHISDRYVTEHIGDAFVHRVRSRTRLPLARPVEPARPPRPRANRRPAQRQPVTDPPRTTTNAVESAAVGNDALLRGDHGDAIRAFRQWTYLSPNDPLSHFHLARALEASGDPTAARAYATARSVMSRLEPDMVLELFGGYRVEDVLRLLDEKVGGS